MEDASPPYAAKAFANLVLDWADGVGVPITPLKLQKMLYFIHADYLCRFGEPLINEEFEAWAYGPVVPSVYAQFKEFSRQAITKRASTFDPISRSSAVLSARPGQVIRSRIKPIFDLYIDVDAGLLSALSHKHGGPWERATQRFEAHRNINRVISNELIVTAHNLAPS
ncbi:Panacea domain-containing protein [Brevundimonas sp.]|uniref:Panacea domain-containing protein n=1 Tax=Brevundimonas sp. TaxID=1871086 RepID=UPI002D3B6DBC|nr:type II toxin-antitoxin system antitoxin SocA domain-containing protein [Brevundimonas sp.]HYC99028.1 type II toxin-antitoxin system antitoxin SocA domain-containing protein [Brevundimonas sp.]